MFGLSLTAILLCLSHVHSLMPIGANLPGVRDWIGALPYVDLVRQARSWGSAEAPWDKNCPFDPKTGWPTRDFGIVFAADYFDLKGNYRLYAKGNAQISITGGAVGTILNKTYDASTNTLSAVINIPEGSPKMMLSFQNTTGPGLKDLVILQPGYDLSSKSKFSDLFVTHLSRFSLLRFMDWTNTNGNTEMHWNETTPLDWPQYTPPRRNPWQTIPALLNQINKPIDIWINIPHAATDDYILKLAQMLLKDINPASHIYVEYSNEVWNCNFLQCQENLLAAKESVLNQNDPLRLKFDNNSDASAWASRRTAYQIKRISDLFKRVFGKDNVGQSKRVRPIYAVQAANPWVIKYGLEYLDAVHGPPSTYLHGIGVAPYFNLGPYRDMSNLNVNQVLDALNISVSEYVPERGWGQKAVVGIHAVYAAWYKLNVYAYEGATDTAHGCGECSLQAKIEATRHPRLTDISLRHLNGWSRYGFRTFNWFTAGAGKTSEYGSWPLLEDMRQETLVDTTKMFSPTSPVAKLPRPSPKLKAIDQYRQGSIEMNFGIPVPSSNVNATLYAGHPEPNTQSVLSYVGPKTWFYYPLKIVRSPMKIKVTVSVAGEAGILEGSINNEQFMQVNTPKTLNANTYQSAPPMQFNIVQSSVPSLVTLRLRGIKPGFSIRSFDVTVI